MSFVTSYARMVPPPSYMQLPGMGLDISDSSLKYVQLNPNYRHPTDFTVGQWGDVDIPAGAVEKGQISDEKKLSSVLKSVYEQTGVQYVHVSLPEERAYIFETEVKRGTSQKEIVSQLEFRLEEHVPISPRDAFFDYDIVGETERSLHVSVVVYARDTILAYHRACALAGLTPLSFEVEAQAIARATLPRTDEDTHMVIDFGKSRTGIGIIHLGNLLYTSTIEIGGVDLSRAMRQRLGDSIAESELTRIKNTEGLLPRADDTGVHEALLSIVSVIKDELATRLQYWHTRGNNRAKRRIKSIILSGGSANLKGVNEYLTQTLGIPTYRADVWQNVFSTQTHVPPIEYRFALGYGTAIGLALKNTV